MTVPTPTDLQDVECSECGMCFWMRTRYVNSRREDHGTFYCPNGHNQYFPAKTEAEQLKAQLEAARRATADAREQLARERSSHASTKGKLTKTLNRVHQGVCPHCNRTFMDLQKHMVSRHADADPKPQGKDDRP